MRTAAATSVSPVPIDLHTHSTTSDGSLSPTQLVELAATIGLDAVALTDHDTLDGIAEAAHAASQQGIELIPGVEISLDWDRGGMHMVVLWLAAEPGPLQDRLAMLQAARNTRNARIVERLNQLGMDITLDEIEAEAGSGSVGRPHFAAVMVRKGYVTDSQTAFDCYLANGRPAYMSRDRLGPEEAIDLALRSGGVPVLAHPHTVGLDTTREREDMIERLAAAGLVGLECHYGGYDAEERAAYLDVARRFKLLPSGGSDFHGTYKKDVALGTGSVGLHVPSSILEPLRAARR
jgi:3',5'-nucleoside bisphosphate phosphatase